MRGGAQLVHSVDSSAKAIDLTNANIGLNFPDDKRHEAFTEDAFRFLSHIGHEQNYDLIVLDPPAFAKHKDAIRNAIKGYTRLNTIALQKIEREAFSLRSVARRLSTRSNSVSPCSRPPQSVGDT